jgi:peptidoglycan hydrolase-like protein with peptidoglycan-binding domain
MATEIGRSTDPSTAQHRSDVSGSEPASFRYNNPGAQYPSAQAARFGQTGYGIIGGGHKIARFPSPVNGAASNFDLLSRSYVGMTIGAAGTKWTGAHGFGVPGYDSNALLTSQMVDDTAQAVPLLKAIASRESGRGDNLTDEQWLQAHAMFRAGSADAFLDGSAAVAETEVRAGPGPNTREAVVTDIQHALSARGFNPGEIDGEYGMNTQAAVVRFQQAQGLEADGVVGPQTAAALGVSLQGEVIGPVYAPRAPAPVGDARHLLAVIGQILGAVTGGKVIAPLPTQPAPSTADPTALVQLVAQLVKVIAPSQGAGTATSTPDAEQLRKILEIIQTIAKTKGGSPPLGQVNGALGETIGKLLNGKKSAIGIIGALATTLLSQVPAASGLGQVLALLTPAAGLSQFALPIFLAMSAWGVLGKLEKWAQGTAPPPKIPV